MLKNSLLALLVLVFLASCVTVSAPKGSVPRRTELTQDAFGGWISVLVKSGKNHSGELIGFKNDSLFVLTGNSLWGLPLREISSARLIFYKTDSSRFATWTMLGFAGSLSNGLLIMFSGPLWLLSGIVTTNSEDKRINYLDYPPADLNQMMQFSRFPQGIPEELDLGKLISRPLNSR